jgi:hypothetical protein
MKPAHQITVSPSDAVVVKSDNVSENFLLRLTKREKQFIENQARRELRTQSNFVRSLVIDLKDARRERIKRILAQRNELTVWERSEADAIAKLAAERESLGMFGRRSDVEPGSALDLLGQAASKASIEAAVKGRR